MSTKIKKISHVSTSEKNSINSEAGDSTANEVLEVSDEPILDGFIIEEKKTPVLIEQIVTPIIETPQMDQQFNYSKSNMQKVYMRVNNEYKQAIVYLSNSPVVVYLAK